MTVLFLFPTWQVLQNGYEGHNQTKQTSCWCTSKKMKVAASDTVAQSFTEMMKLLENVPSDSIESKI